MHIFHFKYTYQVTFVVTAGIWDFFRHTDRGTDTRIDEQTEVEIEIVTILDILSLIEQI